MKTKLNIICYISMCLLGIYLSVYQNAINSIAVSYSINSTAIGFIISLHFLGSLTAPVVFGEISDRIGKKAVVVISYGIMALGLYCNGNNDDSWRRRWNCHTLPYGGCC